MRKDAVKPTNARKKNEAMPADFQDRFAEYEGNPFCLFFRRIYLISLPANTAGLTKYPGFAGRLSPCAAPGTRASQCGGRAPFCRACGQSKKCTAVRDKRRKRQKSILLSFCIPKPAITAFRFLCTLHKSAVCIDK